MSFVPSCNVKFKTPVCCSGPQGEVAGGDGTYATSIPLWKVTAGWGCCWTEWQNGCGAAPSTPSNALELQAYGTAGAASRPGRPWMQGQDRFSEVLLAWRHNGRLLQPDHGYPLRVIIPGAGSQPRGAVLCPMNASVLRSGVVNVAGHFGRAWREGSCKQEAPLLRLPCRRLHRRALRQVADPHRALCRQGSCAGQPAACTLPRLAAQRSKPERSNQMNRLSSLP